MPYSIRGPQRRVNSNPTPGQARTRNAFRTCIHHWHNDLSNHDITAWANHAKRHPHLTTNGKHIILTAWSDYLSINLHRAMSGVNLLVTPPND